MHSVEITVNIVKTPLTIPFLLGGSTKFGVTPSGASIAGISISSSSGTPGGSAIVSRTARGGVANRKRVEADRQR